MKIKIKNKEDKFPICSPPPPPDSCGSHHTDRQGQGQSNMVSCLLVRSQYLIDYSTTYCKLVGNI
jgi:hypothetical protein